MLPIINFYGNHNLDFLNKDIDSLEYYTISELRKIDIPDDILLMEYDSLREQFPGEDLSRLMNIGNWCPVSFHEIQGVRDFPKIHIVSIGPMGMRMVFTPQHIVLPSIIYERVAWYSPLNKDIVQIIRSYYYEVIKHFGGDKAFYVDERICEKYYSSSGGDNSALISFEQKLIERYGTSKKTLLDYAHSKYPKYYIDFFTDLK
jgi:hypothetical protein